MAKKTITQKPVVAKKAPAKVAKAVSQPKPKRLAVKDVQAKIGSFAARQNLNATTSTNLIMKSTVGNKSEAEKTRMRSAALIADKNYDSLGDSVKKYTGILNRGLAKRKK